MPPLRGGVLCIEDAGAELDYESHELPSARVCGDLRSEVCGYDEAFGLSVVLKSFSNFFGALIFILINIYLHREKKIFTLKVCFSNYKIMMLFVSKLYFLIVNDISL